MRFGDATVLAASLAVMLLAPPSHGQQPAPTSPPVGPVPPETPPIAPAPSPDPDAPVPTPAPPDGEIAPPITPIAPPPSFDCRALPACVDYGLCTAQGNACVAASPDDCKRSRMCEMGLCTLQNGQCVVGGANDCRNARACKSHGMCDAQMGRCVASEDLHCQQSQACSDAGMCSAIQGMCVPGAAKLGAEDQTKNRSDTLQWAGLGLGLGGVVLAGISVPFWLGEDGFIIGGLIMSPTAAVLIAIGTPMLLLGATDIPTYAQPRSEGMMAGGLVLAGLGMGGLTAGAVLTGAETEGFVAVPLILGTLCAIGGGALAAVGAETTTPWDEARAPTLRIGAGSLEVDWKF